MTEVFFIYFRFHSVIIKPELMFCNSKGMVTDMDGSFSSAKIRIIGPDEAMLGFQRLLDSFTPAYS